MKKFLTVLLVIAVMFTFSFGSTIAYANATSLSAENKAKAVSILDEAYQNATAVKFDVDYDSTNTDANKYTTFTVEKTYVQQGIYAAYQAYKKALNEMTTTNNDGTTITVAGVTLTVADLESSKATYVALVKSALETSAIAGGEKVAETYDAAFSAFKAELTSIVNNISTEAYTTTKYDKIGDTTKKFVAKNGNSYDTSKEAAEADKAWALSAIANAKFDTTNGTASADKEWETNSYADLYDKVFKEVFTLKTNKDSALDTDEVTSIYYVMKGETQAFGEGKVYSTTTTEKNESASLDVKKALAKAQLLQAITAYTTSTSYKASYDNAIAAMKETYEYLADSASKASEIFHVTGVKDANSTEVDVATTNNGGNYYGKVDYTKRTDYAAQAKADAATNKQIANIQGTYYDDTKADDALKTVLRLIYLGGTYDRDSQKVTKNTTTATLYSAKATLTAGQKAELKAAKDYSEVEETANGTYKFNTYNTGSLAEQEYYAKEFEAVKAAADAYCAAIDKATTSVDVDAAEDAYKEATLAKNIENKTGVDGNFTNYVAKSKTVALVSAYWDAVVANAKSARIFVSWDNGDTWKDSKAASTIGDDYKAFAIDKGARSEKEADALYAEACKVIDAYKTPAQCATEASNVKAMIDAFPSKITLADKATVVAAYDAYKVLPAEYKTYVANAKDLKDAVDELENLEAVEVAKLINALPAASKITVADKAAVKAAKDAYKAWDKEEAYNDAEVLASKTNLTAKKTTLDNAYKAVKDAELQAIKNAYTPLYAKWQIDKLTVEDAKAIKSLQDAVAAYVDEYQEAVSYEETITKMAAAVAALEKADAQANVEALKIKASSTAKKGSITVKWTVTGDASAIDGYEIWKSTKVNKGYKKAFTTTKTTYKNTKNLKKGTRYYYKVRAYKMVDGVKVTSDWSNKANRKAK